MRTRDLHELPKVRDGWSYLYVEHCKIDREDKAIAIHDKLGVTPVPCAALSLLMLGPGVSITHAAVLTLADSGCLVAWVGENSVRFYASGMGETRQSLRLMKQAALASHAPSRLMVVRRLYEMRFPVKLDSGLTLQQIRGKEGVRVRDSYAEASRKTGVAWTGRTYNRQAWASSDPINRALSSANACLYGVAHSAIVAAGYSPALGFIHVGKMLSFVYDIADLYKAETTIPTAFECVGQGEHDLERRVRLRLRDSFREANLLGRIVDDIAEALNIPLTDAAASEGWDLDPSLPAGLWDDQSGAVPGGVDYSPENEVAASGGDETPPIENPKPESS